MAEETSEAPKKGKPIGLIIGLLVGAAAGAGGGFVAFQKTAPPPEVAAEQSEEVTAEAAEAEAEAAAAASAAADFQERLLTLDPVIVNIAGDGYARLLKVKVELECESVAVREEAEARLPQIRDGILTLVSSKQLADVTGFEGKALLKDDLRDRINQLLEVGSVQSVLFTEFVVQ